MRKGRKVTVAAVILLTVLGLTACGKSKEDYFAERMEAMGGSLDVSGESENSQQMKDLMDGLAEDFANQKAEIKEDKKSGKKEVSFGTWEGKVYTNKYMGLTAKFDSEWTIYSAADLQQINGEAGDILEASSIGKYLDSVDFFKDMMVENVKDLSTVNITYMKMAEQEREESAKLTEKEIVQKTVDGMGYVTDAYAQMGMTIRASLAKEVYFLGERRTAQYMLLDYMGNPYYTLQLYDYHSGEYATVFTVASFNEDKTLELLDMFSACE